MKPQRKPRKAKLGEKHGEPRKFKTPHPQITSGAELARRLRKLKPAPEAAAEVAAIIKGMDDASRRSFAKEQAIIPKRRRFVERKAMPSQFSSDGQVEFRNGKYYLHEPLASEVQSLMRRTGATLEETVQRGLDLVRKEVVPPVKPKPRR